MRMDSPSSHRQQGGIVFKLLLLLAILFGIATVLWIWLLPGMVIQRVEERTGFAVKVGTLTVNPFTAHALITGLMVKNPAGWPAEDFLDVREFRADVSLFSLLGNRVVVDELVLDVARVTIVRNDQGMLNANVFREGLMKAQAAPASDPTGPQSSSRRGFLIKHLKLKFDKMVYADYFGGRSSVKEYPLNVDRDLHNVDSVTQLASIFSGSALGILADASGLLKGRPELLQQLAGTLKDAGKKTGEKLKGLLDSLDKRKP